MTLFLAGYETTATALTWTWYLLSQHPEAEARLHAELNTVLGDRLPTAEDLPRLEYTERVLAESLRLYPPVGRIGLRPLEDYTVQGTTIPKDSAVFVSPYVSHRDPRWFPEPERWTPAAKAAQPKYTYFPFGAGPRLCIGESFARMAAVLTLATLARHWRPRLVPGHCVEPQTLITLRPRYGMKMTLERRSPAARPQGHREVLASFSATR
jgi:cytochrome P450